MAKLQHYVPQFYLKHWCDSEEKFWIYPVDGRPPYRGICKNYAAETHLYRTSTDDPTVHPDQERWFCNWEGLWANYWPDIFDRGANQRTRRNISLFLGTLAARRPSYRNEIRGMNEFVLENIEGISDAVEIQLVAKERTGHVRVSELREQAKIDHGSVSNDFVRLLPALSKEIADCLMDRQWGVVYSRRPTFITGDNPFFIQRGGCEKAHFGFATPGTFINFPISQTRFLVICDEWDKSFCQLELDDDSVFINRVVNAAERFVFARHPNNLISDAISARVSRLKKS